MRTRFECSGAPAISLSRLRMRRCIRRSHADSTQAAAAGMLTIALTSGDGEAVDVPADFAFHVPESDRSGAHELHLATYHMLWELVHIVLNHRGIGEAS